MQRTPWTDHFRDVATTLLVLVLSCALALFLVPQTARAAAAEPGHAPDAPDGLTVDDAVRPLDVEGTPQFGWLPRDRDPDETQTAYRIEVFAAGLGTGSDRPVWDSGRVRSAEQAYVPYRGPALTSGTSYRWTVRTWDRTGRVSPWAPRASFDTGLRDADWQASWIRRREDGGQEPDDYTLARKEFTVADSPVVRARIYVAASQQYALHLNGRVVDRGGAFSYPDEGFYRAVDVTDRLRAGQPAVVGALYHWYGAGQGRPAGEPGLLVRLVVDHADGTRQTVVTDGSWRMARGPWRPAPHRNDDNGDYVEDYDATAAPVGWDRPGFDADGWSAPRVIGVHPAGVFTHLSAQQTNLSFATAEPVSVKRLRSGALVADFGKVIPAVPVVRFRDGQAGRRIALQAGYRLAADGSVSRSATDDQNTDMSYAYTQRAGDQTFRAFTYLGFRYLEVDDPSGRTAPGDIAAVVQHNEVDPARAAQVHTSDPGVDAAYRLMMRSARYDSQMQFLDTPTREKGEFLADSTDVSLAVMTGYGERRLSRQAIEQFAASQRRYWPDGRLNAVYPNGDGKRDIPDFTELYPQWVWDYYLQSGDRATLADVYPVLTGISGYVRRYLDPHTHLVTDLAGGSGQYLHGIVDWPENMRYGYDMDTAARTTVNILAVDVLTATADAARALGHTATAATLRAEAQQLTAAINDRLRRPDGIYLDGLLPNGAQSSHASQIANAYALAYGVAPAASRSAVAAYTASLGMQMGPMTAHRLLAALAGRPQDVVARLTDPNTPGWAAILAQGGTFTWESWDAPQTGQSLSHGWGSTSLVDVQQTLLGVTVTAPGAAEVRIAPPGSGLAAARGRVPTQRGTVRVDWRRAAGPGAGMTLSAEVPDNVTAQVVLPARSAGEVRVEGAGGARLVGVRDGAVVYRIGSGTTRFRVTGG